MTDEERAAKTVAWLEHLRAWQESGLKLAAYVRQYQLKRWEAYDWRRRLRRRGLWRETQSDPGAGSKVQAGATRPAAVRFTRVRVQESQARISMHHAPMLVRVSFGNGRCAELQLLDVVQLAEVFAVLERGR